MDSVNISQNTNSNAKVSNLYKKLGISNNSAIKPPLPKEKVQPAKKTPRRQTVFVTLPQYPEVIKNLQRSNTIKYLGRSSSNDCRKIETIPEIEKNVRNATPKSRFLSNFIMNKERGKENDAV